MRQHRTGPRGTCRHATSTRFILFLPPPSVRSARAPSQGRLRSRLELVIPRSSILASAVRCHQQYALIWKCVPFDASKPGHATRPRLRNRGELHVLAMYAPTLSLVETVALAEPEERARNSGWRWQGCALIIGDPPNPGRDDATIDSAHAARSRRCVRACRRRITLVWARGSNESIPAPWPRVPPSRCDRARGGSVGQRHA